ncbi:hypothetical protein P9D18_00020 [Bacillus licheniformis]|uniref:TRADD-N-associated membrane domain-containing protein n=1 Tax=Bacillus TaxID=1386 RepID=UPI0022819931|nr:MULTISPECIES: hypothetical protein [Bacillus]MCY9181311.1 hypothetical protein [Bacillus haynesii]MEC1555256.1 hypothetical protein [Bacillus licheniformis]
MSLNDLLLKENFFDIISAVVSMIVILTSLLVALRAIRSRQQERYLRTLSEVQLMKKDLLHNNTDNKDTDKLLKKEQDQTKNATKKRENDLNVYKKQLDIHQKQATTHSNIQFYVGLIMSLVGFILLICIIIFAINSNNLISSSISIIGSVIFEGISLMFLKESQKLRISVKDYYDSLIENTNQKESIILAEKIQDETLRSLVQAQLSFHLMGIDPGDLNISNISEYNFSSSKNSET